LLFILLHSPTALCFASLKKHENAAKRLCHAWDLQETDSIRKAIQNCLELYEAIENSSDLSQWLIQRGVVSNHQRLVGMISRHPLLLARALTSRNIQSIPDILHSKIGMKEEQYYKMTSKKAVRSQFWTRPNVRQILHLFLSDLGFSREGTMKVIMAQPQLLNYRVATLRQTLDYLRDEVGLNASRMILKRPMVLTYSVKNHLRPIVDFLKSMGSKEWLGWRQMLESYPQLLFHSRLEMKRKLAFLATSLELSRRQDAVHIVSSFPPIFWLRAELLQEKMDFLQSDLHLDTDELTFLVTSYPQVLGLSIEQNLRPKLSFLLNHLTMEQLKEFIAYQPSLLAYSLENRLRPRIELLKTKSIEFRYSPRYIMSLTDAQFQKWVDLNTSTWSPV
jgi:mTERF domain-containing protein